MPLLPPVTSTFLPFNPEIHRRLPTIRMIGGRLNRAQAGAGSHYIVFQSPAPSNAAAAR